MGNDVVGVIPAAGYWSRLKEFGKNIPKSMLRINGKPLIQLAIESLKRMRINKIVIIVGYKKDVLLQFLEKTNFSVELIFVEQKEINGVIGALLVAKKYLTNTFVQYNPDNIFTEDQDEILKKHLHIKPISTYIY